MSGEINRREIITGTMSSRRYTPALEPAPPYTVSVFPAMYDYETRPATVKTHPSPSGWRPPTSFAHTVTAIRNPNIDYSYLQAGTLLYQGTGVFYIFSDANVASWAPRLLNAADIAVNRALLKLSNQQSDFGENFAEREQADRMIGERIDRYSSQLTGRYIARHRRDWRRVKEVSPLIRHGLKYPQSWLEFQYGALPLLSDIYGAFQVIKNQDKMLDGLRTSVKSLVVGERVSRTFRLGTYNGMMGLTWPPGYCDCTLTGKSFAFVRLDYRLYNPVLAMLQQLSLVNPALLAWNLLPYSFVLDWALPVGNYLQAWTADLGWEFMGGTISTVRKLTVKTGPVYKNPDIHVGDLTTFGGTGSARFLSFGRSVFTESPAPRVPHFKNPLSLRHTANALSLLATALAR